MQEMTEINDNKKNEKFEEFKRKYDEVEVLSQHTETIIAKVLSSKQVSQRDKTVLELFQFQQKMLSDVMRNSLAAEYKVGYLEESLENLYSIMRSTLTKTGNNLVNVNSEVEKLKLTLNNPMYYRIDEFINMVAKNEAQNKEKQEQKQKSGSGYVA